jgi:hypothetical protein
MSLSKFGFAAIAAAAIFSGAAWGQQKQTLSFKVPASAAKYVEQHTIAVGDVPGHELRVFDLVRQLGSDGPMIAGSRVKEIRSVGYSDYTNLSGPGASYGIYTLENGDKFFTHTSIVSHAVELGSVRKGATNLTSGPIIGGTGKLSSMRGTVRNASVFNPQTGSNESRFDVEYWLQPMY